MKIIHGIILAITLSVISSCNTDKTTVALKLTGNNEPNRFDTLLNHSVALIDSGKFEKAITFLDSLKSLASQTNDTIMLSGALNNEGYLNLRKGNFDLSISFYRQSLNLDQLIKDSTQIGAKLKNIGISYKAQGAHQMAIRNYRESLIIMKALRDSNEIASINNSIGNVLNSLKDYDEALTYLQEAESIWRMIGKRDKLVLALGNKGNALLGLENIIEAIDVYEQALVIKRQLGKQNSIAITLNNLGEALLELNQYSQAEKRFLESIKLREESGQYAGIALVANNLAHLETKRGRFEKAQDWLNRAKLIIDETGATDKKLENLRLQKELYLTTGRYKKALETDALYDEMNQTAFNQQVVQVNELQYTYDLDQEEKAKELAQSRLSESEAREETQHITNQIQTSIIIATLLIVVLVSYFAFKLRKKNRHIENLMRELHHRVKNHLGMISGMFGAQTEGGNMSNTDLLEEAKTRVEAVNGIHRRLYRQDEYEFVNMQEYLTELVDNSALVFGLFNKVEKHLEIKTDSLEIDKAISVGLIANEVICNTFKRLQHTEKPMLKIVLEKAKKGYRMVIFNNAALNQKPITESTGFGKELIKRLTDNLKGHSHTTQQNGFHFELTFP